MYATVLPWYIAGPLIGLVVPIIYLYSGRKWGVSSTFRDICAATIPSGLEYFRYEWWKKGAWRLVMVAGLIAGGGLSRLLGSGEGAGTVGGGFLRRILGRSGDVAISSATHQDLASLGITDFSGLVPAEVFSWSSLLTVPGLIMIVGGGFLVGFGTRYAGGCTSGHAISGLANLRLQSLVAVFGFFAGGLFATHVLLPWILSGGAG